MDKNDIRNIESVTDERVRDIISQVIADEGTILYLYLRGSHCQGLDTETSDKDYGMFYVSKIDNIIDMGFNYRDQYSDDKNDVYCQELGKVCRLLNKSNPTVLETLFVDDEFVVYEHPVITELKKHKDLMLSRQCFNPFFGYATSQIEKGISQAKMVSKPIIERKGPLDFCYTFHRQGSTPIKHWLDYRGLKPQYVGLNNIPNADFMHGVFYDFGNHFLHENVTADDLVAWYRPVPEHDIIEIVRKLKEATSPEEIDRQQTLLEEARKEHFVRFIIEKFIAPGRKDGSQADVREELRNFYETHKTPLGYKGICGADSEELRLSSVENGAEPICHMHYNKDKFSSHCKDYARQETWKRERNPERFRQNMENLKKISDAGEKAGFYDSKNLAACYRMIQNCIEIARDGKYIVNRRGIDRDYILKIKKGELTYNEIMEVVKAKKEEMNLCQKSSTIRETIDVRFLNGWLLGVRHMQIEGKI